MISTQLKFILAASAVCLALFERPSTAGVVAFNNFGPNDTYRNEGVWQGTLFPQEVMSAQRFTPSVSGSLVRLELGLIFHAPASEDTRDIVDELTLSLVADVDGKPGTQALWSQLYVDQSPIEFGHVAGFDVIAGPSLTADTKYWLISKSPSTGSTPHTWFGALGPHEPSAMQFIRSASGHPLGVWNVFTDSPGLALRVTVIPEPAAAALMLAASAALLAFRRRTSP
jgi:hypothetical protein